jgi:phosphatidylinositol-3-phosphatase
LIAGSPPVIFKILVIQSNKGFAIRIQTEPHRFFSFNFLKEADVPNHRYLFVFVKFVTSRLLFLTAAVLAFSFISISILGNYSAGAGGGPAAALASNDIVLYASEATVKVGNWIVTTDSSAAGGARLWNPDSGAPKIVSPAASPANYFDMSFGAQAGTAYRLWIRGKAQNDSPYNDSVFVQFSGSVNASAAAIFRIGTASATTINLEDDLGVGLSAWGWQDNGWGVGVFGPPIYFASTGAQTIRVQVREDGLSIDQIVLSPVTYFNSSPGTLKNDNTILPKQSGIAQAPSVTSVSPASGSAAGGTAVNINGANFRAGASANFGGVAATSVNVTSASSMTAVTPAHPSGIVNVTVTNSDGQSGTLANGFNYAAGAVMPRFGHVFVVVEENHGYSSVIGSSLMPYLNNLATKYGLATASYANTHPSIGNYFMLTAGQIITNDDSFSGTVTADNIVRQLTIGGKTWKAYAESLPSTGYIGGDVYPYSKHHNPFAYFSDITGSIGQANNIVPFTQLANDLASSQPPDYSFIIPNQQHNAHDCPAGLSGCTDADKLAAADSWLSSNIQPLITSAAFRQDGLLIITFDESVTSDIENGGGHIPTIVISSRSKPRYTSSTLYQHQNTLRTMAEAVGLTSFPGTAATALNMAEFIETSAPTISSITPNSGSANGGTQVTLTGTHFSSGATVTIGGAPATNINVISGTTLSAIAQPHAAGLVDVTVTNGDGQKAILMGAFNYLSGAPVPTTVVLYASEATVRVGNWNPVADPSAAGGTKLWNQDAGVPKLVDPLASPANYFEMTLSAQAGIPYRLWIRGKAENDFWGNDSVFVQFSDSVDQGAAIYRIGTTSATTINLEDCSGCGLSGWGWQDNGWGVGVMGPLIYFANTGMHTLRIQVREDGLAIDQIVLSPDTYLNASPGALKNDNHILPKMP